MSGFIWTIISSGIIAIIGLITAIIGGLNRQLSLIITGALLFVFALAMLIGSIITYLTTKDNYKVAIFFRRNGKNTEDFEGQLHKENSKGIIYKYGNKHTITIPNDYGFNYYKHKRRIELIGKDTLVYPKDAQLLSQPKYTAIIDEFITDHIGADIIHAVKSKGKEWILFVILAFALGLLIAFGVSIAIKPKQQIPVSNPSQTIQQSSTNTTTEPLQLPPTNIVIQGGNK